MDISVIIPTYNRINFLKNTLTSLENQNYPINKFEVIVVDNNSSDQTKEFMMNFIEKTPTNTTYILENRNGLHYGRHTGAKNAKGNILAYLDDDVICCKYWIKEIIDSYNKIPNAGCVGGKVLPKWEKNPPDWINKYYPSLSLLDLGEQIQELNVPKLYGCNMSIKKDLLYEVGGFNPDGFGDQSMKLYRGDGETGLLQKVIFKGDKIIYNPNACVLHVIPETRLSIEYMWYLLVFSQ